MQPTLVEWASAGGAVAGALVIGLLLARLVASRLHKAASLTSIHADDVLVAALRPLIAWWFTIAGLFVAKIILADYLKPRLERVADKVLIALLVGSVTVALARLAADTMKLVALRSSGVRSSSSLFVTLARIGAYVLGALVLLQSMGISVTPVLGALGVGGIAVALALQPTLSNAFSGIQLLASGTLRPGDFIDLDGRRGYVEDVKWRYTTLRQLPNNLTIVPNSVLSESIFTNCFLPSREMSVVIPCGTSYASDLARVEAVTIEVAKETMAAMPGTPEFEPFVRFREFGDSSINFDTILRVSEFVDQYRMRHEFVKNLHARFAAEGIEIPFPQRVVHLPDETQALPG